MAGTDGGGGSMDYEYNSHPHVDSTALRDGRASRCPAMANGPWASRYNASNSYYGAGAHASWQSPYNANPITGYGGTSRSFHQSSNAEFLPAQEQTFFNTLPEPRAFRTLRPQLYSPSGRSNFDMNLSDPSPPTPPQPATTSTSPTASASTYLSTASTSTPSRVEVRPSSNTDNSEDGANTSAPMRPTAPPFQALSQSPPHSTFLTSAQREVQNSPDHPTPPQMIPSARPQLPVPSSSRHGVPGDRPAATLGALSSYRELAHYVGTPVYEAARVAATQTSDDDSDREAGARPTHQLAAARQAQVLRGRINGKRVASKRAVQSLVKVEVDSLDDTEKTCVICYNDFGVASPEGIVETPLRLPKCKHVFGDKCILKWLGESYSCPYCRDKLESEMAQPDQETIRRMVAESEYAMSPSMRRLYRPERAEALLRARERALEASRDSTSRGERRALPEDSSDAQRRQRPRFSVGDYGQYTLTTSSQSPSSEQPPQRTPAWQHSTAVPNPWAAFPHNGNPAPPPPDGSQSRHQLPPFMTPTGYMHALNAPEFPPMYSRDDGYYQGPTHASFGYVGTAMSPLAPQTSGFAVGPSTSARQLPPPVESFRYPTHHHSNSQMPAHLTQSFRVDDMRQGISYSGSLAGN